MERQSRVNPGHEPEAAVNNVFGVQGDVPRSFGYLLISFQIMNRHGYRWLWGRISVRENSWEKISTYHNVFVF